MSNGKLSSKNDEVNDCVACRLISGFGLVGMGAYFGHHGSKLPGYNKIGMYLLSAGAAALGTARLLNLPPFGKLPTEADN